LGVIWKEIVLEETNMISNAMTCLVFPRYYWFTGTLQRSWWWSKFYVSHPQCAFVVGLSHADIIVAFAAKHT
jgi:hypothetical protein